MARGPHPDRRAYLGRADDRDDGGWRRHEPRAGQVPARAGLRDEPSMYGRRPEGHPGYWSGPSGSEYRHSPEDSGGGRWTDPYGASWASAPDRTTWRVDLENDDAREPARSRLTQVRGPYAGIGPRGYKRSDERVRDDVCERLALDDELDATDVEVAVLDGEVVLRGRVGTRDERRLAEDLAWEISGVTDVVNELRVGPAAREE